MRTASVAVETYSVLIVYSRSTEHIRNHLVWLITTLYEQQSQSHARWNPSFWFFFFNQMVTLSMISPLCLPLFRIPLSFQVIVKLCNPLLVIARHIQVACLFLIAFVMDNDVLALLMLASLAILSDNYMLYILLRNHISVAILFFLTYRLIAQVALAYTSTGSTYFFDDCSSKLDGKCLYCKDFLHEGLFCLVIRLFFPMTHLVPMLLIRQGS